MLFPFNSNCKFDFHFKNIFSGFKSTVQYSRECSKLVLRNQDGSLCILLRITCEPLQLRTDHRKGGGRHWSCIIMCRWEIQWGASSNPCPQTKMRQMIKAKKLVRGNSHVKRADESERYKSHCGFLAKAQSSNWVGGMCHKWNSGAF